MERTKAICFFGITRSLCHTVSSINDNVISPMRQFGSIKIYSHFFLQREIYNPRSGESGRLNPDEHLLLPSDWLCLEEPDLCLESWDFEMLSSYGDFWGDGFRSLRNLVHQLHSLRTVTNAALEDGVDICLFCRPDLYYHDSLARPLKRAMHSRTDIVHLPYWQPCTGMNDRFAICSGVNAIAAYGRRIELAQQYCCEVAGPLHSERLLHYSLTSAGIPVNTFGERASRVRLDGRQRYEDFLHPVLSQVRRKIRSYLIPVVK